MNWRAAAVQHAMDALPSEACGLLVLMNNCESYWPCRNLSSGLDQFTMHPEDYVAADMAGEILAVVHSHPNAPPTPSKADRMACDASGLPWHIVSVPSVRWERMEPIAGIIQT